MGSHRDSLVAAMVVLLVLDLAAMGARLHVRTRLIKHSFGRDDILLCLTMTGYVIHCILECVSLYYGYAAPHGEKRPYYDKEKATEMLFANQLTIYICAGLVKLAVACVLLRLVTTRGLRWILYSSMLIVVAWTVVMTIYASWLCASGGSSNFAGSTTCAYIGYFRTSTNIVIDYFYALLPVYILWNVQMSIKTKLSVLFLLGLGAFASSATIVKLVIIVELQTAKGVDATALHYDLLLWADIELGMAIFAASAAALRPLLRRVPTAWDSYVTKASGGSSGRARRAGASTSGSHGAAAGPYVQFRGASADDIELGRHVSRDVRLERTLGVGKIGV